MASGTDNERWFWPAGSRVADGWDLVVDDTVDGWQHTGLRVATLEPGSSRRLDLDGWEAIVLPLSGSVTVDVSGAEHRISGRASVFAGPTDSLYAPSGSAITLTPGGNGSGDQTARVAVCLARDPDGPGEASTAYLPAEAVPIELRGAGIASRQVRNVGVPGVTDANRIIACEVITPAGNWSSWPPHKHDEHRPGEESELEEIYYFETQATDSRGVDPIGYQRVYGTDDRPIDVLAEVRTGDAVLIPHGWHGPAIAAPNADLYYLNVMAGPGPERVWLICDDPAHAWVRESWPDKPIDPRLT